MDKRKLLKQIINSLDENNPDDFEVIEYFKTYQFIKITPETPIQDGSLIKLENQGNENWYFMIPVEGGKFLTIEDDTILTITPFSKLGQCLIDKVVGDSFDVQGKSTLQKYTVLEHH